MLSFSRLRHLLGFFFRALLPRRLSLYITILIFTVGNCKKKIDTLIDTDFYKWRNINYFLDLWHFGISIHLIDYATKDIIVQASAFIRIFIYWKIARNSISNKKYWYRKKWNFKIFGIDEAVVNQSAVLNIIVQATVFANVFFSP